MNQLCTEKPTGIDLCHINADDGDWATTVPETVHMLKTYLKTDHFDVLSLENMPGQLSVSRLSARTKIVPENSNSTSDPMPTYPAWGFLFLEGNIMQNQNDHHPLIHYAELEKAFEEFDERFPEDLSAVRLTYI